MKKAIIYGGAFNPPTLAHQAILQACVNYAVKIDSEVWLLPSGERKDKKIGRPLKQRIMLAEALCRSIELNSQIIKIETQELYQAKLTETYITCNNLTKLHPDYKFIWVFGSDSVATIESWQRGKWLKNNVDMLVIPRKNQTIKKLPRRAEVLKVDAPALSSTEVRERIKNGMSIDNYVPGQVKRVLKYT